VKLSISGGGGQVLRNGILWGNNSGQGEISGLVAGEYDYCNLEFDPFPGGTGNISSPPLFVNPAADNYHLLSGSPCIDTGLNAARAWDTDMDQDPRVLDGNFDGSAVTDMGADEVAATTLTVTPLSGTYQAGTDIRIDISGPPLAPCNIYAAVDLLADPFAPPPAPDHPFYGTILLDQSKLAVPGPVVAGQSLDGGGLLSVVRTLPSGPFLGMHVVLQATVGDPAFGWGQLTPVAVFTIEP